MSGWWTRAKYLHDSECPDVWWWVYIIKLLVRIDNIYSLYGVHPDNELPPKNIWLDDKAIDAWVAQCRSANRR